MSVMVFEFGVPVMPYRFLKYFLILLRFLERMDVECLNVDISSTIKVSNPRKNAGFCLASQFTASVLVM